MGRKVIQLSPSTSVVSLPAQWVRKNDIKKGDELFVTQEGNELRVSTRNKRTKKHTTIDCSKIRHERLLYAKIEAAYISGYDEIRFTSTNARTQQIILSTTDETPGIIVSEHSQKQIVFTDITGNHHEDVNKILQRIYSMLLTLTSESQDALERMDHAFLKDIKKLDYPINSYISYAQRQIARFGYDPAHKAGLMTTYLKLLEVLGDKICSAAKNQRKTLNGLSELLSALRAEDHEQAYEIRDTLEQEFYDISNAVIEAHVQLSN